MEHLDPGCNSEDLCIREGISTNTLIQWTLNFFDVGRDTLEKAEITEARLTASPNLPLTQQVAHEIDRLKDILTRLIDENIDPDQEQTEPQKDNSEPQSSSQS